jgi:hypothetical protein
MKQLVRSFGFSLGISLLLLGLILWSQGISGGIVTLILAAIELAFSFDNAVINAKILTHLSPLWRTLFLSVGILIAIFGVRAFLPLVIVSLTANLPLGTVADLALNHPLDYAHELEAARPAITAFGGAFLLMLSLHFFISDREVHWIRAIERPLSRYVRWWLPLVISLVVVAGLSFLPGNKHAHTALVAGTIGLLSYGAINGFIALMNRLFGGNNGGERVGWAAFATFFYLELLDASLSFDGVIGAFAITNEVVLIAAGLGIGAIWVRSLTVYMVRQRTLEAYKYLEHGAHYAITVLAITMLLGVVVEVPDFLTGVLCLGLIAAAVVTSRQAIEAE